MFEPQADVLQRYRSEGILVGKVQVSSAIQMNFRELSPEQRTAGIEQLSQFAEDRYLHQTSVLQKSGLNRFYEDLPEALKELQTDNSGLEARVHFHVPIYLESFGNLQTSRNEIFDCMNAIQPDDQLTHFEIETYAWNVLPDALQKEQLADGIAEEMDWF